MHVALFFQDRTGAVTIDWVALTAGILLLGIIVVYGIFSNGVASLVSEINQNASSVETVSGDSFTQPTF